MPTKPQAESPYAAHWPNHQDCPPHGPIENEWPDGSGFWHRKTAGEPPEWVPTESIAAAGFEGDEAAAKEEFRVLFSRSDFRRVGNLKHLSQLEAAKMHYGLANDWPQQ